MKSNGFTVRGNGSLTSTRNNYMMRGVDVWNPEANEYQTGDYRRFHDGYRSKMCIRDSHQGHLDLAREGLLLCRSPLYQ